MQLEEFRKKKAAERAKKAAPSSHVNNSDASSNQKQPSEVENVRVNESDGVTTSDGIGGAVIDTLTSGTDNEKNLNLFSQSSNQGFLAGTASLARNDLNISPTNLLEARLDIDEAKRYNSYAVTASADVSQNNEANKANDIYGIHTGGVGGIPYGTTNNQSILQHSQESQEFDNTSQSSFHGMNENQSNKSNSSVKDYAVTDHGSSPYFPSKIICENSVDTLQRKPTDSGTSDSGYSHGSLSGGNILILFCLLI